MNLKEKTIAKLNGELKGLQVVTGALIGVLGVLLLVCIYGITTQEDNTLYFSMIGVPIALFAIIPLNYGKIKKIKTELESRK